MTMSIGNLSSCLCPMKLNEIYIMSTFYQFYLIFKKNEPIPASFSVYFRLFNMSQLKFKFDESIDCVLGIQIRGGWMEGADESTELRRHPKCTFFQSCKNVQFLKQFWCCLRTQWIFWQNGPLKTMKFYLNVNLIVIRMRIFYLKKIHNSAELFCPRIPLDRWPV